MVVWIYHGADGSCAQHYPALPIQSHRLKVIISKKSPMGLMLCAHCWFDHRCCSAIARWCSAHIVGSITVSSATFFSIPVEGLAYPIPKILKQSSCLWFNHFSNKFFGKRKESTCMFSAMVQKSENWTFRWNPELIIDCFCVLECNAPWGIVPEPIIGCACVPKGNTPWREHTLHLMCRCTTYIRWVNGKNTTPIIVDHRTLITFQMRHLSK